MVTSSRLPASDELVSWEQILNTCFILFFFGFLLKNGRGADEQIIKQNVFVKKELCELCEFVFSAFSFDAADPETGQFYRYLTLPSSAAHVSLTTS